MPRNRAQGGQLTHNKSGSSGFYRTTRFLSFLKFGVSHVSLLIQQSTSPQDEDILCLVVGEDQCFTLLERYLALEQQTEVVRVVLHPDLHKTLARFDDQKLQSRDAPVAADARRLIGFFEDRLAVHNQPYADGEMHAAEDLHRVGALRQRHAFRNRRRFDLPLGVHRKP